MKNLQASCNKDADNIVKQAEQQKAESENINFLINLAAIAVLAEKKITMEEKPKTFDKAWNHQDEKSQRK